MTIYIGESMGYEASEGFSLAKLALGRKSWLIACVPAFGVALWGAFMIGEMAVNWSDALAWPAKTILCPSGSRPEIRRTSEWHPGRGNESAHSSPEWSLVCHTKLGMKIPAGVFWVQLAVWFVLLFPVFLIPIWLILRAWARRQTS